LRPTPGWPFVDWRPSLNGLDRKDGKGPDSCVITIQYYGALRQAAELEGAVGTASRQTENLRHAEVIRQRLDQHCLDAQRGLYADTPDKREFSQHANALAVLYDLVPREHQRAVLDQITGRDGGIEAPQGITGTTYYFSYYLAEAIDHAGLADRYDGLLKTWRSLLQQNFTTWPEEPDPSRSDTHGWSAHPTSGLLTYVAGIRPAAPGFKKVRIAPALGALKSLDAAMAHPSGLIETRYRMSGQRLRAIIRLPEGLSGDFEWGGKTVKLRSGNNRMNLDAAQ
jgi:alpha-L-rhamnosidase